MYYKIKNHSKLFLFFCVALALSEGGGLVSAEGTPSVSENTGLNDMTVLAKKTGNHVTIEEKSTITSNFATGLKYPSSGQPTEEKGVLYVHDNSLTVSHRTAPIGYSSITGVEVAPSFAPSDDGSVKGIVRIENNETTVKNSNLPDAAVYAVHDLTDNSNGRDSSSLVAEENKLKISDSKVQAVSHIILYSPYSYSQNSIKNSETMISHSVINGNLFGTYQREGTSGSIERSKNTIGIYDSTVGANAMGSNIYNATIFKAEKNNLIFSNSTSSGFLTNDYAYGTWGTYQNNVLRVQAGSKAIAVFGESFTNVSPVNTESSSVMVNNKVLFTGKSTAGAVLGTVSENTNKLSEASHNLLTIADGSSVYLGVASITTGNVSNNQVNIVNGNAQVLVAGLSTGSGSAEKNIISLSGARMVPANNLTALDDNQAYYGNYFISGYLGKGFGSSPVVIAGFTNQGTASNNEVWVAGDTDLSKADVYGALRSDGTKPEGSGNTFRVGYENGTASNWNEPKVQGLYHFDKIAFYDLNPQQAGLVITNTLNLPETVELEMGEKALAKMKGTEGLDEGNNAVSINGTALKKPVVLIDASKAQTVKGLADLYHNSEKSIENIGTWNYQDGGVTVTGTLGLTLSDNEHVLSYGLHSLDTITYKNIDWLTDGTVLKLNAPENFSLAGTKIDTKNISFTADSLAKIISAGDYSMTLLDTSGNTTLDAVNLTSKKGTWNIGNALMGTGEAYLADNGNVIYQMDVTQKPDIPEKPIVEATAETHNALIANEAGLGVLAAGRDRMEAVLTGLPDQEAGIFTFANLGGSKERYDTGSSVTTRTWSGLAGAGNERQISNGDLGYALFYEYGQGNYDVDGESFHGSGDIHYNGGGAMVKLTARNKNYYEGSFRAGRIKNNADNVLHDINGNSYSYHTSTHYWSGHIGIGHIFDLTDEVANESRGGIKRAARDMEIYGKYFQTHMGSNSFMADDVQYSLDSLDSRLLRIGIRVNHRNGQNDFYYGLAWDYEFDGEGRGCVSLDGLRAPIEKTDTGGSSAMLEVGWKREATKDNPWYINTRLTGYAGEHKGLGGSLFVGYYF